VIENLIFSGTPNNRLTRGREVPLNSYIELAQPKGPAVVGDREAGRFLLPEIDLCGGPLTSWSGISDQVEDPAVDCDILPHRAGGGGASSEGRAATL